MPLIRCVCIRHCTSIADRCAWQSARLRGETLLRVDVNCAWLRRCKAQTESHSAQWAHETGNDDRPGRLEGVPSCSGHVLASVGGTDRGADWRFTADGRLNGRGTYAAGLSFPLQRYPEYRVRVVTARLGLGRNL